MPGAAPPASKQPFGNPQPDHQFPQFRGPPSPSVRDRRPTGVHNDRRLNLRGSLREAPIVGADDGCQGASFAAAIGRPGIRSDVALESPRTLAVLCHLCSV